MADVIKVRVFELFGSPICVSAEDGQRLFDKIKPLIEGGHRIEVSFDGIETLISTFLNAAIGQLYGVFSEEKIRESLTVSGLESDDVEVLKRVVENAKSYFKRPKEYDQAWEDEVGDEE